MSEVRLTVGGRDYTVACADGQEAHVAQLARAVDAKLQQLGGNLSAREAQNLLFAALLLADELHEQRGGASEVADLRERLEGAAGETRQAVAERDEEIERLRTAHRDAEADVATARTEIEALRKDLEHEKAKRAAEPAAGDLFGDPDLAPALERFADLLENCADQLESKATTP